MARPDDALLWERWDAVDNLLSAALDRPAEAREAFVRAHTIDDPELCALVLRLLGRADEDPTRVAAPPKALVRSAFSDAERATREGGLSPGHEVGRYRIVRELGRGGMATVYEAERADGQFDQRVALKVLRRGLDTDDLIRRFRVERQILSELEHPHIARLLDGGSTADGRPYLVMELVDGVSVTTWAERHHLDRGQRLRLLLGVIDAVATAHRSLVVHRDIKPSNVLVDREGRVRLLDFGIAKMLTSDGTHTDGGVIPLTPRYAAPEQRSGGPITTATDVYQLGLLVRELLTGMRPGEPAPRLGAEIQLIIDHATREEPTARYESAAQLGEDIQRHLSQRPIIAHAPSLRYRATKLVRRQPWLAPAVLLLMVLVTGYLWSTARHARQLKAERDAARAASERALATEGFLIDLFESADPYAPADPDRGRSITVVEALEVGRRRLDEEFQSRPALRAALLTSIGSVFESLDQTESARLALEASWRLRVALGDTLSPEASRTLTRWGIVLSTDGESDSSRVLLDRSLAMERARRPIAPELLAEVLKARAAGLAGVDPAGATVLMGEAVEALRSSGSDQLGESLRKMADITRGLGRLDEAERLAREALERIELTEGSGSVRAGLATHTLGQIMGARGLMDHALPLLQRSIAVLEERLGAEHDLTIRMRNNLGVAFMEAERYREAESLHRELLAIRVARFGASSSPVAGSLQNLAAAVAAQGRYPEALRHSKDADRIYRSVLPPGSVVLAFPSLTRAQILLDAGEAEQALAAATAATALLRGKLSTLHAASIMADCRAGRALHLLGRTAEGRVLIDSAVHRLPRAETIRPDYAVECLGAQAALGSPEGTMP